MTVTHFSCLFVSVYFHLFTYYARVHLFIYPFYFSVSRARIAYLSSISASLTYTSFARHMLCMFSLLPALIIIPPVSSSDRSFFRIPLLEDSPFYRPSGLSLSIVYSGMTRGFPFDSLAVSRLSFFRRGGTN